MRVASEQAHFLNEEQKNIKQKIMEELVSVFPRHMKESADLFDNQTMLDLVISCLVMYMRDSLVNVILCINMPRNEEIMHQFLGEIFNTIGRQVTERVMAEKMQ